MLFEEVGDAADGVFRAVFQIDATVAVEVDGVVADARGQKLRQADGAGVGAAIAGRAALVFPGEQQQVFQLATKQLGARRVVEGQRGECREGFEAPGIAAIEGFDADDGDDELGWHAGERLRFRQRCAMSLPESPSGGKAARLDETAAISLPGAHARIGRRLDRLEHRGERFGAGKERAKHCAVKTMSLAHLNDESLHVGAFRVAGGVEREGADEGEEGDESNHGLKRATRRESSCRRVGSGVP